MRTTINYVFWILLSIGIGCIAKHYLISIYRIPSASMEPTVLSNDYILAIKPFPIGQISSPKRGEIWLFKRSSKQDITLIKRIIGIPGDTVTISKNELRINSAFISKISTNKKFISLSTLPYPSNAIFPNDTSSIKWSGLDFGPLWIPAKGKTIKLDNKNRVLYKKSILDESPNIRVDANGLLHKDGTVIKEYTFKKNHYFALGDNILISTDSRHWGFIPEENLISIAKVILFSQEEDIVYKRFFKSIH